MFREVGEAEKLCDVNIHSKKGVSPISRVFKLSTIMNSDTDRFPNGKFWPIILTC